MKKSLKNTKGITLIVLVITIIILLILSGITIQSITHTGIFKNAKQAQLENKRAQIIEYLKLKLLSEQTNDPFGSAEEIITATRNNVIENIEDLKKIGKEVTIGEISTEEEFKQVEVYFYVTVDGDLYKVELKGVSFVGKIDEMNPAIKIAKITNTTSTITVEVTTARNEGGKLEYYVKSEDEEEYKLIETSTEEKYTYKGLEQGKKYSVKVVVVAKNKKTAEAIGEQTTGKVTELTTANAKFTYNPSNWTNTDVVATASTDVTRFTIQTSLDGQTWSDTPSQTRSTNGPIYARLWDGTNAGGMLTGNVTKIDKTAPTFTVNATNGSIGSNGAISFSNVVEKESGISGYYIGQDNPATKNVTFGNTTSAVINKAGTWYMAIKDNAGNVSSVQSTTYYSLALNTDGATNYTGSTSYIKSGTYIKLPTGLVKTGYKADTWTGGISGITLARNSSLSPIWSKQQYTLYFNGNGGTPTESSRQIYYGNAFGNLPSATRAGYNFAGWYTAPNGGSQADSSWTIGASNYTLYAHWTVATYTLNVSAGNNTYNAFGSGQYTAGTVVTIGFTKAGNNSRQYSMQFTMPSHNVNFVAETVYEQGAGYSNGGAGGTNVVTLGYTVPTSDYYFARVQDTPNVQEGCYLRLGGVNGNWDYSYAYLNAGQSIDFRYWGAATTYGLEGTTVLSIVRLRQY